MQIRAACHHATVPSCAGDLYCLRLGAVVRRPSFWRYLRGRKRANSAHNRSHLTSRFERICQFWTGEVSGAVRLFVAARAEPVQFSTAIKAVIRGERYVTPLIDWKESTTSIRRKEARTKASDRLSPRQREVLQLVAEGQQRNRRPLVRIGKDSRFSQVLPQARIDAQFHGGVDSVRNQAQHHRDLGQAAQARRGPVLALAFSPVTALFTSG